MHYASFLKTFSRSLPVFRQFHASSALNQKLKLDGRIAVAIGCTEGIGLSMARRLAQDGAHVVLSSRKQENVDKAVDGIRSEGLAASGFVAHASRFEDRKALLEHVGEAHGGFDILVNNAGANAFAGPILDTTEIAYDKTFDTNLKANFFLVRDAVPYMEHREHTGSILLTSSVSGYTSHLFPGAYAISKSAIFCLIKAFMPDLMQRNIRINCVALGVINTRFADVIANNEQLKSRFLQNHIPMKRIGEPDECSGIASFLCSDEANYTTGETFVISGGALSRL